MHLKGTGDAQGTSNVRDVYIRALKELRQDAGCTPERLLGQPELHAALVQRVQHAGGAATAEACVTELGELVKSLGDPRLRDGLLAALRLDYRFRENKLTNRRRSFQQYLKGHPDAATRADYVTNLRQFERRENEAIHGVASFLANQKEPEQASQQVEQEASTLPVLPDAASGTIEASLFPKVHSIFLTYRFSSSGAIQRQDVVKQLYAPTTDTVRTSSWVTEYFADRRKGVAKVEGDFGWHMSEVIELEDGTLDVTFELPRKLTPEDGLYTVGHHVIINSDVRSSPITYWTPGVGAQKVDFRLVFHPEMRPVRAWWFTTRSRADGLREPSLEAGQHLDIFDCVDHFYIQKHFVATNGLAARTLHGVAWIWPSNSDIIKE